MKKIKIALSTVVLIATVGSASAETRYIKDIWNVGLYTDADSSSQSIGLISSGTKLEVISEQGGYTQVQTSTGETGWIKTTYLVSQPTNDIKLKAAQRKITKLNDKIQMLSNNNANAELAAQLESAEADNKKLLQEYSQQKQQFIDLQAQVQPQAAKGHFETVLRLLTIALVALACGFIVGKRMTEAKVKAKFNGIKVW